MHFQYVNNFFNIIFFMFIFLAMNIEIILELYNRLYASLDLLQKALKQKSEHYNGYVNQITTKFSIIFNDKYNRSVEIKVRS
jgi:hypothetical protein